MNRIVTAALMAAVFVSLSACGKSDAELRAEAEAAQRVELRKPVLAQLSDPDSATFRAERLRPDDVLCGEYNAKNAMGGYVGYSRFIVAKGRFAQIEKSELVVLEGNKIWQNSKESDDLGAGLDKISEGYDTLIAQQRRDLGYPPQAPEPKAKTPSPFERRWKEYCA